MPSNARVKRGRPPVRVPAQALAARKQPSCGSEPPNKRCVSGPSASARPSPSSNAAKAKEKKDEATAKKKANPKDGDDSDSSSVKSTLHASEDEGSGGEPKDVDDASSSTSTDCEEDGEVADGEENEEEEGEEDEDSSSTKGDIGDAEKQCTECFEELLPDQQRARSKRCHKVCEDAARAALHALKGHTKKLEKWKQCKTKDPHSYARAIKALRKNPNDSEKKKQDVRFCS